MAAPHLLPPPRETISQWADANRKLSPVSASEPGQWYTARAEYQRGIMDAISDPLISVVACMAAAQVGKTEIELNTVAFHIHRDPAPILTILPSIEAAESWSTERLAPMLQVTDVLRDRIADPTSRSGDNRMRFKNFAGGFLALVGANAPTGLAMRPIRIVIADEVDRYPVSAGTEGDPLKLAAKRQTTFWNRKTVLVSTPVRKETSAIYREWLRSDQRKYFVPCPECDHAQTLRWENVKWDKAGDDEVKPDGDVEHWPHKPDTAHYVCEDCGAVWDDVTRWNAITAGHWVATHKTTSGIAGFHIPGFLSPWLTLTGIVTEFLNAQGSPGELQVWTNTVLGEPWEDAGETVDISLISGRGEAYGQQSLPAGIRLITTGVDVQGDRLEAVTVGFGFREEMWFVSHDVLLGDPAQQMVWQGLDDVLMRRFMTENGRELRVRGACVDTGGHHADAVMRFCKARLRRHILPIKGAPGVRPIWPKRGSRTKNRTGIVFVVGVDAAKDAIYGRLRINAPGPGYVHFPVDPGDGSFDAEFFDQLSSEIAVTKFRLGRPYRQWVLPSKKRNEALDCAVYAMTARASLPIRINEPTVPAPRESASRRWADVDSAPPFSPPRERDEAHEVLMRENLRIAGQRPQHEAQRGLRRIVRRSSYMD